jgi:hypothetical protein
MGFIIQYFCKVFIMTAVQSCNPFLAIHEAIYNKVQRFHVTGPVTEKMKAKIKMYKASYSLMFMKYIHNMYLLTIDMTIKS